MPSLEDFATGSVHGSFVIDRPLSVTPRPGSKISGELVIPATFSPTKPYALNLLHAKGVEVDLKIIVDGVNPELDKPWAPLLLSGGLNYASSIGNSVGAEDCTISATITGQTSYGVAILGSKNNRVWMTARNPNQSADASLGANRGPALGVYGCDGGLYVVDGKGDMKRNWLEVSPPRATTKDGRWLENEFGFLGGLPLYQTYALSFVYAGTEQRIPLGKGQFEHAPEVNQSLHALSPVIEAWTEDFIPIDAAIVGADLVVRSCHAKVGERVFVAVYCGHYSFEPKAELRAYGGQAGISIYRPYGAEARVKARHLLDAGVTMEGGGWGSVYDPDVISTLSHVGCVGSLYGTKVKVFTPRVWNVAGGYELYSADRGRKGCCEE